jgi:L-lactate utilization protein LutC
MPTLTIPADFESRLERFTSYVEPLGVTVGRAETSEEATVLITDVARELGVTEAITSSELIGPAPGLIASLAAVGLSCIPPQRVDDTRDKPLGLSFATLAVAETGSVMLAELSLADRAVGLLTIANIVVVRTRDMVPSLAEAASAMRDVALRSNGSRYGSFVTGPSRTADIEMSLTVGVQGPARLYVLFIDDLT